MKMDPDDYQELEAAIRPLMVEIEWATFRGLGFKPKQWRWILLNESGLWPWVRSLGLTEGEIDAALRKITKG